MSRITDIDHTIKAHSKEEAEQALEKFLNGGERPFKLISRGEPYQPSIRGVDNPLWYIRIVIQPM